MTKEQLQRGKEIEAELKAIQSRITDICIILDRGIAGIGIEAIGRSCYERIFPTHDLALDFVKQTYDEYLHRKKVLEEEFDSL